MIAPPKIKNEVERINTLASFNILDTLPETDYDNITSIAAQICDCNISLVTIIDCNRQWFKSKIGIEVEETPLNVSFCGHAINDSKDIFIVEDARLDKRFFDNPFVLNEPHVIFYAGVPLITNEGIALGTLCVVDSKPKKLSPKQIFSLKALGRQVVNLLEFRKQKLLLEDANEALTLKNKELEQFTFIASHDLQEPLRTIKNFAGHLDKNYSEQLDSTAQQSLSFIMEASQRMSVLLRELLNYSLIGHNSFLTPVDSNNTVQSILNDLNLVIQESKAIIKCDNLPKLCVYKTEFRMLLQNLISNAIKFSKPGCCPKIFVSAVESKTDWEFQIKDNGIGVDKKYQKKIFEIFQRLHLKEEYEGTGIGLSHCKKIIELHHGQVWVKSKLNEGSSFYFTIPKKAACSS